MKLTTLQETSEFITDGTHGSPQRTEKSSGIPLLSAKNVFDGEIRWDDFDLVPSSELEEFQKRVHLKKGDVLMTCVGTIGRAAVWLDERPVVFFRSVAIIRPKQVLRPEYLEYVIRSGDFQNELRRRTKRSSQGGVYLKDIKSMPIVVPPLAKQERIVNLLDEADELRKLRAKADRRTTDLLPALFDKMFGDPTTNPKRLQVVRIGEVVHPIDFGISEALSSGCEYQPGRIAVLRIANITAQDTINYNDLRYLKVSDAKRNQLLLKKGELLFNWRNSPKWVGKTAIFEFDEPCIFASFLFRLRVREDIIEREFLWFYMNHLRRNGFFESKCRQAVSQANFGRDELAAVQIILPPLTLQREFAHHVTEIRELEAKQAASRGASTPSSSPCSIAPSAASYNHLPCGAP